MTRDNKAVLSPWEQAKWHRSASDQSVLSTQNASTRLLLCIGKVSQPNFDRFVESCSVFVVAKYFAHGHGNGVRIKGAVLVLVVAPCAAATRTMRRTTVSALVPAPFTLEASSGRTTSRELAVVLAVLGPHAPQLPQHVDEAGNVARLVVRPLHERSTSPGSLLRKRIWRSARFTKTLRMPVMLRRRLTTRFFGSTMSWPLICVGVKV